MFSELPTEQQKESKKQKNKKQKNNLERNTKRSMKLKKKGEGGKQCLN